MRSIDDGLHATETGIGVVGIRVRVFAQIGDEEALEQTGEAVLGQVVGDAEARVEIGEHALAKLARRIDRHARDGLGLRAEVGVGVRLKGIPDLRSGGRQNTD